MYHQEHKTRKEIYVFVFWTLVAVLIPLIAFFAPIRPASESLSSWFQRSGSVMTILCLVLDLKLFTLYKKLNPVDMVDLGFNEFKTKYTPIYKALTITLLFLTATGTIIWGYGDLIIIGFQYV